MVTTASRERALGLTNNATTMCSMLEISVSGHRSWKRGGTPDRTRLTDAQVLDRFRCGISEMRGFPLRCLGRLELPSQLSKRHPQTMTYH